MICAVPKLFLVIVTATGSILKPVPPIPITRAVIEEAETMHAECRKRGLGECLTQIRHNPKIGHTNYKCATPSHEPK